MCESQPDEQDLLVERQCPYTHTHTRYWCGYDECRES